ncbi:MAG: cytochrome c biogenesis CcdA family protein [Thermomicrobiales bacterium]
MPSDVSLVAAFVAGLFSFTSPCCLPLVPIFLAHLAGISVGERDQRARLLMFSNAVAYTAGFSLVFILLGVAFGAAGSFASAATFVASNRIWLVRLGGALLIVLGLHQLGIVRISLLDRQRQVDAGRARSSAVGSSFIIGVTFGAGWSPCVGPILGIILTMAMTQADVSRATLLLATYSAGLSVPFLIASLALGSSPGLIRRVNRRLHAVTTLGGAAMLGVGAIMLLGIYQQLFVEIVRVAPWTPWEPNL